MSSTSRPSSIDEDPGCRSRWLGTSGAKLLSCVKSRTAWSRSSCCRGGQAGQRLAFQDDARQPGCCAGRGGHHPAGASFNMLKVSIAAARGAFDGPQQSEGEKERQRQENGGEFPGGRVRVFLRDEEQRNDDVTDDEDGEIRRGIVGSGQAEWRAAMAAFGHDAEEAGKQMRFTAGGAAAGEASGKGRGDGGNRPSGRCDRAGRLPADGGHFLSLLGLSNIGHAALQ